MGWDYRLAHHQFGRMADILGEWDFAARQINVSISEVAW